MSANDFLEDRLNAAVNYGAEYGDDYSVEITETKGGLEYRKLLNPLPKRKFNIGYTVAASLAYANILSMYHRCYKNFGGFRVKCNDDYTTNAEVLAPTAFDQTLTLVSAGVYQMRKAYGGGGSSLPTVGLPYRTIYKPVSGTALISIQNTAIRSADWSISTVTGLVTFVADVTGGTINTASATNPVVLGFAAAPPFVTGQSVVLSAFAGGTWSTLNGQRYLITVSGNNVTLTGCNGSGLGSYTAGTGVLHTRPQSETVKGGCEFDIPVRFGAMVTVTQDEPNARDISSVEMIEILNP